MFQPALFDYQNRYDIFLLTSTLPVIFFAKVTTFGSRIGPSLWWRFTPWVLKVKIGGPGTVHLFGCRDMRHFFPWTWQMAWLYISEACWQDPENAFKLKADNVVYRNDDSKSPRSMSSCQLVYPRILSRCATRITDKNKLVLNKKCVYPQLPTSTCNLHLTY